MPLFGKKKEPPKVSPERLYRSKGVEAAGKPSDKS
jgi:hypothetical protein